MEAAEDRLHASGQPQLPALQLRQTSPEHAPPVALQSERSIFALAQEGHTRFRTLARLELACCGKRFFALRLRHPHALMRLQPRRRSMPLRLTLLRGRLLRCQIGVVDLYLHLNVDDDSTDAPVELRPPFPTRHRLDRTGRLALLPQQLTSLHTLRTRLDLTRRLLPHRLEPLRIPLPLLLLGLLCLEAIHLASLDGLQGDHRRLGLCRRLGRRSLSLRNLLRLEAIHLASLDGLQGDRRRLGLCCRLGRRSLSRRNRFPLEPLRLFLGRFLLLLPLLQLGAGCLTSLSGLHHYRRRFILLPVRRLPFLPHASPDPKADDKLADDEEAAQARLLFGHNPLRHLRIDYKLNRLADRAAHRLKRSASLPISAAGGHHDLLDRLVQLELRHRGSVQPTSLGSLHLGRRLMLLRLLLHEGNCLLHRAAHKLDRSASSLVGAAGGRDDRLDRLLLLKLRHFDSIRLAALHSLQVGRRLCHQHLLLRWKTPHTRSDRALDHNFSRASGPSSGRTPRLGNLLDTRSDHALDHNLSRCFGPFSVSHLGLCERLDLRLGLRQRLGSLLLLKLRHFDSIRLAALHSLQVGRRLCHQHLLLRWKTPHTRSDRALDHNFSRASGPSSGRTPRLGNLLDTRSDHALDHNLSRCFGPFSVSHLGLCKRLDLRLGFGGGWS